MNENYDFNSKKFLWLLVLVCLLFVILIVKAFQYLPVDDNNAQTSQENVINDNSQAEIADKENEDADNADEETSSAAENADKEHKSGKILIDDSDKPELEEIDAPEGINIDEEQPPKKQDEVSAALSNEELALRAIISAKKNFKDKDYSQALEEYRKVPNLTNDSELIAMSYEGISELYANSKRYGTALSFAAKAYNVSPSISREMLIAKIYYRAGNTENAITRVNNLLKKDFAK